MVGGLGPRPPAPPKSGPASHCTSVHGRILKTFIYSEYQCIHCIGSFGDDARYINFAFYNLRYITLANSESNSTLTAAITLPAALKICGEMCTPNLNSRT